MARGHATLIFGHKHFFILKKNKNKKIIGSLIYNIPYFLGVVTTLI